MPPPSYCSKVSTRSTGDHEPEIDNSFENSKSEISDFVNTSTDDDCNKTDYDSVGIVKSLLGPSLEDAVLRTLEFGKSLIHNTEENEAKKMLKQSKKDTPGNMHKQNYDFLIEEENRHRMKDECQSYPESRTTGNRMVFTAKLDKNALLCSKPNNSVKKLTNVSKIRSLDSDLKQVSPSPEKIKRQLEALIQIHKEGPPDVVNWNVMSKTSKLPLEMTVMPTFCGFKNEADLNCSSSCDVQSQDSRKNDDDDPCSTSRIRGTKKRLGSPTKICQAPEFLSSALGPTLDVSIIDNLKMMRDIFKCDRPRSEMMACRQEGAKRAPPSTSQGRPEVHVRLQKSEDEMLCRIEALQRRIEELEHKEECLIKRIEEEEREREVKKRALEEAEQKLNNMKMCLETLMDAKEKECEKRCAADTAFEARYECLQQRICMEEEKLTRLKDQYECYKREMCDARNRKEALKRNKSLLDAWDVIASRVCHTRLPSFSKAYNLERKCLTPDDASEDIHCCLTMQTNPPVMETARSCCSGRTSRSRSRCRTRSCQCQSNTEFCYNAKEGTGYDSLSPSASRKKYEDIPFPIQRDITCGLHQSLKTCSCSQEVKMEGVTCSSEDELFRKHAMAHRECKRGHCCYSSSLDTSAEVLLRKPPCGKTPCRSKSDTTLRNNCSKIVKVMWAVTRINIFQDNCRTYEVMDATPNPPSCVPARTEGIFVVKSNQKKCSQSPSKRKSNFSGL